MTAVTIAHYLSQITVPDAYSHKGANGKVLVIGGSELFHAASKWCLDTVSRMVDMVFYCSVSDNNKLMQEVKGAFWNGIVVERSQCEAYAQEADVIVIGPGMERTGQWCAQADSSIHLEPLSSAEWQQDAARVTNYLLARFPQKKWVVDAGALQMVDPFLLNSSMVITPHHGELERMEGMMKSHLTGGDHSLIDWLTNRGVTVLLKGPTDYVYAGAEVIEVTGGNAGMTKGGTGDVLAGLIAGLFVRHTAEVAVVAASYVNKQAGEELWQKVGPYYSATQLVEQIPQTLWQLTRKNLSE